MSYSEQYTLPGGGVVELDNTIFGTEDGGAPVIIHPEQAAERPIERWRDKAAFQALLRTYSEEFQEIESMLWDVLVLRWPDYAFGEGLNLLGRIVGVSRGPRTDPQFRARIKAQIAINSSFGRVNDIDGILRLLDAAAFVIEELFPASFRVVYNEPAAEFVQAELPAIVAAARAVGIGASVSQPIDVTGLYAGNFTFSDAGASPTDGYGFGDAGGATPDEGIGALGWYARA